MFKFLSNLVQGINYFFYARDTFGYEARKDVSLQVAMDLYRSGRITIVKNNKIYNTEEK